MLSQAYELCEEGDFSNALKMYDLALKKEPENINALIDKGVTLQNMGRIKQAIKYYDRALDINPKNLNALVNKGASLHTSKQYEDAIKYYDLALKIDKKYTIALAYKGLSLGELGNLTGAINISKKHYLLIMIMILPMSAKKWLKNYLNL